MADRNRCGRRGVSPRPEEGREEDRAYRAALGFVASKARSIRETAGHLSRRGFTDRAIADAVSRLEGYGYLNDDAYARMLVESRTRLNPRGVSALVRELALKGVEENIAAAAAGGIDEVDAARRAVEKGLYRWRDCDRKSFTRKVTAFLARRGFPYDISAEVCAKAWEELNL